MRSLMRNKRKIYICNRYQDGLIAKYKKPIPLMENYQYTNSDGDLIALGLDFPMYIRIKADIKDLPMYEYIDDTEYAKKLKEDLEEFRWDKYNDKRD